MSKVVVLSSGGLDSTTCLALALSKYSPADVAALAISYGQRHAKELDAARLVAEFYHVPHYELNATEAFKLSDSTLLQTSSASLEAGTAGGLSAFFISDDFDANTGTGYFSSISAAQYEASTITEIDLTA